MFLEDEKVVFLLVNETEDFNQKVLVNEFKYEKLTQRISITKLRYFYRFMKEQDYYSLALKTFKDDNMNKSTDKITMRTDYAEYELSKY